MPSNKLYKFQCNEPACYKVVRSDKWNSHVQQKHFNKNRFGYEIKKRILEVKEGTGEPWKKYEDPTRPIPSSSTLTVSDEILKAGEQGEQEDGLLDAGLLDEGRNAGGGDQANEPTINSIEVINDQGTTDTIETNCSIISVSDRSYDDSTSSNLLDPANYTKKKLSIEAINYVLVNRDLLNKLTDKRNSAWRFKKVSDDSTQPRNWITYSISTKSIYCIPCILFSLPGDPLTFSQDGYSNWKNAARDLNLHEISKHHLQSELSCVRWITGNRIDKTSSTMQNSIVTHHRNVLSCVIDCCRYLSLEMVGLRRRTTTDGKLYNLFSLLAKYNPDAQIYLAKVQKSAIEKRKLHVNFLSYFSILKLVKVMRDMVLEKIAEEVKSGKYSIILDSTQDCSKLEAVVLILRYVETKSDSFKCKPIERVVGIFTTGKTDGSTLLLHVKSCLHNLSIPMSKLVGQSFDGAGNMRGCRKGLKSLIQEECPSAIYTWCSAHRFNLVVEATIACCKEAVNFFGVLEKLYVFFKGHRRHDVFTHEMEHHNNFKIRKRKLKRVIGTRWKSRQDACHTLLVCFEETLHSLDIMAADRTLDKDTIVEAEGLKKQMKSYEFVSLLLICEKIFKVLTPVTNAMQGVAMDLGSLSAILKSVERKLKNLTTDDAWETTLNEIKSFCSEHIIHCDSVKRKRIRKRFFDENGLDETTFDNESMLRTQVYFLMVDALLLQMADRFSEQNMGIVGEINTFTHDSLLESTNVTPESIRSFCLNYKLDEEIVSLELASFKEIYKSVEKNIDMCDILPGGEELQISNEESSDDEIEAESKKVGTQLWLARGFIKPLRVALQFSAFPNLNIVYEILVCLSVTSCSAERALSKVKIIKSPLRCVMLDEYFSAMTILGSEHDIVKLLDNNRIIDKFGMSSTVMQKLLFEK